ncbi:MAG: quinohemoprotein amine dehydrogenase subunit gamma [Proteobacteria bacterium]|nr:quinohemoprotein amine dehydrogenase subunit gamma [Pseudomonadota bacterium]
MKKQKLKAVNKGAKKLEENEVFGMADEDITTQMPIGCTTVFDTGWETNPRPTSPVGNCVPSARDFTTCSGPCWWPAQTPDAITNNTGFHNQCRSIEKDWKKLDFVIKR